MGAGQARLPKDGWQPVYLGADQSPYAGWFARLFGAGAEQGSKSGGDLFSLLAARQQGLAARAWPIWRR